MMSGSDAAAALALSVTGRDESEARPAADSSD